MSIQALKSAISVLKKYEDAIDNLHIAIEIVVEKGYTPKTTPENIKRNIIENAELANRMGGEFLRLIAVFNGEIQEF